MCSILGFCGKDRGAEEIREALARTASRGPDASRILDTGSGLLGFNRLSIMGLHEEGMQPFCFDGRRTLRVGTGAVRSMAGQVSGKREKAAAPSAYDHLYDKGSELARLPEGTKLAVACNGEIYGFRALKRDLVRKGYQFMSDSDCEILAALYRECGTEMFRMLDAEFALVLYDAERGEYIAARDPIGIRPLYYGRTDRGTMVFASEPKNLVSLVDKIMPFPPGHYYRGGEFIPYRDMAAVEAVSRDDPDLVSQRIHDLLVEGVRKRLDADAPVGFLLSGGLDSSLVCGIAAGLSEKPLETWAIGMDVDAIDLKYAREVADHIHANHHEVIITKKDVIDALEPVIELLGTYDITTIRASIGMYLVCRAIHEESGIRVVLTGEISDEIFGYKYTDFAPSAEAFQQEAAKRLRELHMYDVLRADRCISVNSLEARVPFGDLAFVEYCMSIDPERKLNRCGKGKYLLRKAFAQDGLIPESILWREKAAFSDAVGHSLKDDLEEYAESRYTDEEYVRGIGRYQHARPFTKESLLYRDIFERYYPGQSEMVVDFWMPNRSWEGCDVNDPSARVLSNYGASGA